MLTVNMPSPALSRSDEGLLQAFAGLGSQEAFGALVTKYLGMVLGIATRRTGDRALAEEIAQNVFAILARKARGLNCGATLGGWIHRATVIECADALRRRQLHQTRMNVISQQLVSELDGREVWKDAMPLLDDAIDALNPAEREVVLLRFFEGKSFREIGTALGKTDDAAQKQVDRALHKISAYLKGRGVTVPAAVLAAGLASQLAQAAPPVLAQAIAHGALTTASTFNAKILILQALEAMTNTKLKTALFATAALAVPITMQWAENNRLREALDQAQQQRVPLAAAGYTSDRAGNSGRSAEGLTAFQSGSGANLASPAGSSSSGTGLVDAKDPANVAREWEQVLFIADPLQRSQRLSELLGALKAEDAPHIAEAFEHAKAAGIEFADEQRLFLRGWGKVGGAAAVEYAVNHGGQASDGAVAALGGWATVAPRDARVWLEALPESNSKETLVYGLLDGWSTSDFQAAAAYAESRPASPAQGSFRELLLQRALRAGGIAAAQSWVYRIADNTQNGDYKQRAFSGVVQAMLYRDPAAAARWISELDGQAFVGADAVTKTAAKLAEASPTDALHWMATLQPADAQGVASGAGTILHDWARQDPQAAGAWLQANASHPFYDQLTSSYVRTVAAADPNAAKQWADTIRESGLRDQTVAALAAPQHSARLDKLVDWISARNVATLSLKQVETIDLYGTASESGLVGNITTAKVVKANPHGPGSQWSNCASCHAQ